MFNNKILLIHISDTHVHEDDSNNKYVKLQFEKLAKYIELEERDTNTKCLILMTGDIGNRAKASELNNFLKIIEDNHLADRFILTPGNHDMCDMGNEIGQFTFREDAVKHYQALQANLLNRCRQFILTEIDNVAQIDIISKPCDPFIKGKFLFWNKTSNTKCTTRILEYSNRKIIFVLLDSNPQNATFAINFAQGQIGKKQMKILKDIGTNKKYDGWTKIAMLHHHPIYNNYFLKLEDSSEFLKITWNTFKVICFGHKHSSNEWSTKNNGYIFAAPSFFNNSFAYGIIINPDNSIETKHINF
jgi:hypothetical protein